MPTKDRLIILFSVFCISLGFFGLLILGFVSLFPPKASSLTPPPLIYKLASATDFPLPSPTYKATITPTPTLTTTPNLSFITHLDKGAGIHIVYVDLKHLGVYQPLVTPLEDGRFIAHTVPEFDQKYNCALAINGSGFGPYLPQQSTFKLRHPTWDRKNQTVSGDLLWNHGYTVSRGTAYPVELFQSAKIASLVFTKDSLPSITINSTPMNGYNVLPGQGILVEDGQIIAGLDTKILEPRTAIGINQTNNLLIIVITDGRQPLLGFNGTTFATLAQLLKDAGSFQAMALDGGGSTTLIINRQLANSPSFISNPPDFSYRAGGASLGFCP